MRHLETAEQRWPVGRIIPRVKNSPNDGKTSRAAKAFFEQKAVNASLGERRNQKEQTPERPADETRDRWDERERKASAAENNRSGDFPAALPPCLHPPKPREQDERRNDRDEKENVIEVDQNVSGLATNTVRASCLTS